MSVFKKLKGTFQNAHQDIVDGLRAFTLTDNQSRQEELSSLTAREINLDVGAGLLHRFQSNWSLIQSETSKSAQQAEEVAKCLAPMFKIWDKHAESATNLEQEAKAVSNIFATMSHIHTLLDGLREDFLVAEKGLDMLENICEEQEFKNKCQNEQKKLAFYTAKKETEAEKFKVSLAYKHAKNAAKIESAKKVNLQERAEAFMSAFHDDISYYRKHGHLDLVPTENSIVSSLSSVELDQDKEALDSFLGPDGAPNSTGNLELSGDGSYIEDDYIADYSVKQDVDFIRERDYTSAEVISEMDLEDESFINMENLQGVGFVYEEDVHAPQDTSIPGVSKQLSDCGENEDLVGVIDSVAVCDHSQIETSSQESSGDSKNHDNVLATTTIRSTATSTQIIDVQVKPDSECDENTGSQPSV